MYSQQKEELGMLYSPQSLWICEIQELKNYSFKPLSLYVSFKGQ